MLSNVPVWEEQAGIQIKRLEAALSRQDLGVLR
jgi:hypothetical protein